MTSDSALTVAALKALCKDRELISSGKKSDLVERLLKYGATREEVGLEPLEEDTEDLEDIVTDDDGELILEEEELVDDDGNDESDEEEEINPQEDEVLEAEVFVAEIIDDSAIEADVVKEDKDLKRSETAEVSRFETPTMDVKKGAALALTLILLGAGAWWWFSLDAEPFTPDPLRHGDDMGFAVTGGQLVATDDYASQIFQWFGSDDEVCGLNVDFSGSGNVEIVEGDRTDISGEMNDDRLGAVKQIGGNGFSWLTMERNLNYNFDDVNIAQSEVSNTLGCIEMPSVSARMGVDWKEWVELSSETSIRSEFGYELVFPDGRLQGDITTFGLNGFLDSLESLGLGASMIFAPLQLHEILGNTMIDEEAAGNVSGWSWQVTGSESLGDEVAWKILFRNKDLEENCLGHATINILAVPSSPWAVRQSIDLLISDKDSGDCGTLQELLGDFALPDGRLEMKMNIERTSLLRGENLVDLGYSYDSKPDISSLRPPSSEIVDWASSERFSPDLSNIRSHTLEMAVSCIGNTTGGGNDAEVNLQDDGYIWRARDNRSQEDKTRWNMSWLASDDASGWLMIDVTGEGGSEENCTFVDSGLLDDAPDHNRDAIPETVSLQWMEDSRWLEEGKFPEFSGASGLAASSGKWHDDLKIGILVATAGVELPNSLDFIPLSSAGRVTVDGVRSWDDGEWTHTFSFLADASDGQMLGWSHTRSSD